MTGRLTAALFIIAGTAYRGFLLAHDTPPTNSDEATMGLAAIHILQGRHLPVFFYGQAYMGTIEAYLATPVMAALGSSTTALRLPLLALYLAFAVGAYLLTRTLYTPGMAVFITALLALGSDRTIKNQLIAGGGYPELSPALVWLLIISLALARGRSHRHRTWAACWGALVGFMLWDDWLALPYLAVAVAITARSSCWRQRTHRVAAAGGLLVCISPLLLHHIARPLTDNSITAFLHLNQPASGATIGDYLAGGVLLGVPLGTGVCPPSHCDAVHTGWAVVYLVLLAAAGTAAVRSARAATAPRLVPTATARLGLLVAAALTIAAYTRSGSAVLAPVESARYLSATMISLPAVLWPAWAVATGRWRPRCPRARLLAAATGAAVLAATLALTSNATVTGAAALPAYQQRAAGHRDLVAALRAEGVRFVYSDYWTCNLITFATREGVICAVVSDSLRHGLDRYGPYRAKVGTAANPAWLISDGHILARRLPALLDTRHVAYRSTAVAGYHLYQPAVPVHPLG